MVQAQLISLLQEDRLKRSCLCCDDGKLGVGQNRSRPLLVKRVLGGRGRGEAGGGCLKKFSESREHFYRGLSLSF